MRQETQTGLLHISASDVTEHLEQLGLVKVQHDQPGHGVQWVVSQHIDSPEKAPVAVITRKLSYNSDWGIKLRVGDKYYQLYTVEAFFNLNNETIIRLTKIGDYRLARAPYIDPVFNEFPPGAVRKQS